MRIGATVAWLALALGSAGSSSAVLAAHKAPAAKSAKHPATKHPAARPAAEAHPVEPLPDAAVEVVNWVIASGDNGDLPFMIIDKVAAQVVVFDAQGQYLGATPALVGITPGDDSSPGVGDRELSDISPEERTTPAGRFVAKFGLASGNRQVLWVDYETSISLHAVITANKKERRLERLASPTPEDNRITYGCINVPARFYTQVVAPLFRKHMGVVYILPETKALTEVFPAFREQRLSSTP